jgi:hypothetical protein
MPKKGETLSAEQKARMAAGRREKAEARKANVLASGPADAPQGETYELPLQEDDLFAPYELSEADKREIEREVEERLAKERRTKAKKAYAADAIDRQRRQAGETTADEELKKYNDELVSVYVQMPTLRKPNGGEHPPEPIIIDQKFYISGRWYHDIPRSLAVYLMDRMDQARRHVNTVEGRSRSYYSPTAFTMVHQGGAAAGGGGGPSFDGIHRRPAKS